MDVNITNKIIINDKYANVISSFNTDLQSAVDLALQRYLIDCLTARIADLRKKDNIFKDRYGCEYNTFFQMISEDEEYVNYIEREINNLWETDQANWEFCHKGIDDWTKELQNILMML